MFSRPWVGRIEKEKMSSVHVPLIWAVRLKKSWTVPSLVYNTFSLLIKKVTAGVSNSTCSQGQKRTYKVTRGLHYDVDAIMAAPEH